MKCVLNGDTTTTDDRQQLFGIGTSPSTGQTFGEANGFIIGQCGALSAPTGSGDIGEMYIINYRGTAFWKAIMCRNTRKQSNATGGLGVQLWSTWWKNSAAITSITLSLAQGNMVAGSYFALYLEP